ncbi:MAG: two-component regulator propeller domain-containing protein [Pyrinomonadaceae bacterium]
MTRNIPKTTHSGFFRYFAPSVILLLFASFVFYLSIRAQNQPAEAAIEERIFQSSLNLHQWGSINSFHGLPSESVNAISQTLDGFIWFGTDNGLAKFDGRRVQTNMFPALASVQILDLKTDTEGTLWIATKKGAFFYRNETFGSLSETSDYTVNSIYIDNDGKTVLLTDGNGSVFSCSRSGDTAYEVKVFLRKSLPITSISIFNGDTIIGTFNDGLQSLNNGDAEALATRPRPYYINALAKDSDGNLWIGARSASGTGLFLSEKLPELRSIGENLGTINTIASGNAGNMWIGTEDRGGYLFEDQAFRKRFTFENTSGGLRSNKILSTYVDREGVVWFGTDKGVSRYDPRSPKNERISEDVESNFVRTLFETKEGKQYAGTNRGLFEFDEVNSGWKAVGGFERETVYSLAEFGESNLLIGTQSGLYTPENAAAAGSSRSRLTSEITRSITEFKGKIYFAAFQRGLETIEGSEQKLVFESNIISLHNADNKNLWLGTVNKGVYVFDGGKTIQVPQLGILNETVIRSITGNAKDGIWFGTEKGLYVFKEGQITQILAGNEIRSVILTRDSNNGLRVWCAAANGLFNLAYDETFGWMSSRLDIEQGLSSQNAFAVLSAKNGSLLVGTNRGIVRYEAGNTKPLLVASRIVSQRLHQPKELETGIDLDYPQNSLSIDVSAISSRTFPEQFQYSFLLFDDKNKLIDKRFGSDSQFLMENLAPNKYHVEVRAYDRNLIVSDPLRFRLTVEEAPFPLIATILGVLLVIALAALIWAIISQRKIFRTSKQLVTANRELNSARLDLENEAERERHRISRDLHDQTLADLRHLLLMADEVSTEKAPEFRSEIENVSDEIRRICEDLSPSVLENIGFAAALEWALGNAVDQVTQESPIATEFRCGENLEAGLKLDRTEQLQIYRIAQEVLSNIVRHSRPTEITLTVQNSGTEGLKMKIEDNGISFDPERVKKGRGLSNIDARAKLIKADINWKRRPSKKGMIFTLEK